MYNSPRSTAVALLMRESVAWQKKYDRRPALGKELCSSSTIPQSSIVFPLPGSPFTHSSRLCGSCCHVWKEVLSRTQRYESASSPPFVSSIRLLSLQGSVRRKSRTHSWSFAISASVRVVTTSAAALALRYNQIHDDCYTNRLSF